MTGKDTRCECRAVYSACRLLILATGLLILGCALSLHRARAFIDDGFLELGSGLTFTSDDAGEPARLLELNGVRVFVKTQTLSEPFDAVLKRYRALCSGAGVRVGPLEIDLASLATLTAHNDRQGYVACLDLGTRVASLEDVIARFERFSRTAALHEVGQVRYAYAQQIQSSQTLLLTMWTDGEVNLVDFLPPLEGDAPGRDLANVPRPPDSRRVLFSSEVDAPSALAIYRVPAAPRSIIRFYRSAFTHDGWTLLEPADGKLLHFEDVALVAAQRGRTTAAAVIRAEGNDGTLVTLLKGREP